MMCVIGLSGNLRSGSYNTALLRAAARLIAEGVTLQDATIRGIPLSNGEVEPFIRSRPS